MYQIFTSLTGKFNLKGKSFDREFFNEDPWFDLPDSVLNWKIKNADLFDLQTLVSNGLTNFFKFLLIERKESELNIIKVKEPLRLDDYVVRNPEQALRNVYLTGFPLLRNDKKAEITSSSVDAEELKRFKVSENCAKLMAFKAL